MKDKTDNPHFDAPVFKTPITFILHITVLRMILILRIIILLSSSDLELTELAVLLNLTGAV